MPDLVALVEDPPAQVRPGLDGDPGHEERGVHALARQDVEDARHGDASRELAP
jgi:hypothetical protein